MFVLIYKVLEGLLNLIVGSGLMLGIIIESLFQ